MRVLEMTDEQYELLAYALGYANGRAIAAGEKELGEKIRKLWNEIQIEEKPA